MQCFSRRRWCVGAVEGVCSWSIVQRRFPGGGGVSAVSAWCATDDVVSACVGYIRLRRGPRLAAVLTVRASPGLLERLPSWSVSFLPWENVRACGKSTACGAHLRLVKGHRVQARRGRGAFNGLDLFLNVIV